MLDPLTQIRNLSNICHVRSLRVKIQIYLHGGFLNLYHEERCTVSSSSTIHSYGDYLFSISMDIYHEFSEYRYSVLFKKQ